ncbi:MAG: hypothetical protein MUF00_00635, partial [Gemmatimonadaceae bacterium]|nr:hypothetical protein [Gemmatimonadaceae bacterium]
GGSARSDIWVMRDDGTAAVNLTADLPATAVRRSPAWSADGRQVAFVQVDPAPSGTEVSIWIMQRDGSGKRRITVTTTGFDGAPTWSPDGGRLAFVRYFGGDADLMILTLATGAERRIALPGQQLAPAWSPAGDLIAFVDIAAGGARSQLMTMRPNGTLLQLRTLREEWGGGSAPTWIRRR